MTLLSAVAPVGESLIDRFIDEQRGRTAVERFSQRHGADVGPRQARYYEDLIPLGTPGAGEQYAFAVDLDACTGCKACVAACHSLNGLDEGEAWRSVTVLLGSSPAGGFPQAVTTGCHHCVDPACLKGCPVDAYEKDPLTGIVAHLDDQCIGCGYCTLTCPYEVPVYNRARGIVRKCDMCAGRLAAGEAPACVQGCPTRAITITVVETAAARDAAGQPGAVLVAGAPPSAITAPTTVYRSARGRWAELAAPPSTGRTTAAAHPPLATMLVLTQLAVGAFLADLVVQGLAPPGAAPPRALDALIALAAGGVALGASVFHLGRPRYCYRAIIGLRHSWLSREVLAFGGFTALSGLYAAQQLSGLWLGDGRWAHPLGLAVAAFGLAGVACSILIYTSTHRSSWRPVAVTARFALTTATAGIAAVAWACALSSAATGAATPLEPWLLLALATVTMTKLVMDGRSLLRLVPVLRPTMLRRLVLGATGGVVLPLVLSVVLAGSRPPGWVAVVVSTVVIAAVMAGELLERSLFFTSASAPQ